MVPKPGARQNVNGSCVGKERVRDKRVVLSEVKEPEDQVGTVAELKCDSRELRRGETVVFAGGDERAEVGPPRF